MHRLELICAFEVNDTAANYGDHRNKSTTRSGSQHLLEALNAAAAAGPPRCEPRVIIIIISLTLTRRGLPITKCAVTSAHFEPWHEQGTC